MCGDGEGVIPGVNRVGATDLGECNYESLAQRRIVGVCSEKSCGVSCGR